MKAGRRLERGYEQLGADERFRLLVAAAARADEAEIERLLRTCPRRVFQLREPAFTDRIEGSHELTIAVVGELDVIAGKLDAIDAVEYAARVRFTTAADEAEYEAFRITTTEQPAVRRAVLRERGRLRKMLRHLRRALVSDGATVARAFDAVCHDELQVDPRALIGAVAAPFVELYDRFASEQPHGEALEAVRSQLSDAWRTGIGVPPLQRENAS